MDFVVSASAEINPDAKGRPSPMMVRVYELKSEALFQEADYFSLQDADKAALTGDLLAVDQFILRPGDSRAIRRRSHPDTAVIGVLAGYRDLPNATWRAIYKLPPAADASWYRSVIPAHRARLRVELQAKSILIVDEDAGSVTPPTTTETLPRQPADGTEGIEDILPRMPVSDSVDTQRADLKVPEMKTPQPPSTP